MQDNNIKFYLEIKEKGLKITKQYTIKGVKHVHIEREKSNCSSPCCNTKAHSDGFLTRKIKHLQIAGYPSLITYKFRRYKCTNCGKKFRIKDKFVDKHSRISNKLKLYMLAEVSEGYQSFSAAGRRVSLSHTTCIKYFREFMNKELKNFRPIKLPKVLSFDEFASHTRSSKYAFIVVDPIKKRIVDILENRKKATVLSYFEKFSAKERKKVTKICIDLWMPYKEVIEELFPNAIIVADKFHFLRHVFWAFNRVRVDTMKKQEKDSYDYYVLKKYWKTLTKTYSGLSDKLFYSKKLRHLTTNQQIVDYALNIDNDFAIAYELKEDMFNLKYLPNKEDSISEILDWIDKASRFDNPHFNEAIKPFINWSKEIANAYKDKNTLTNGYIEGINLFIKNIKRASYGFKSFHLFRQKILFSHLTNYNKPLYN